MPQRRGCAVKRHRKALLEAAGRREKQAERQWWCSERRRLRHETQQVPWKKEAEVV